MDIPSQIRSPLIEPDALHPSAYLYYAQERVVEYEPDENVTRGNDERVPFEEITGDHASHDAGREAFLQRLEIGQWTETHA